MNEAPFIPSHDDVEAFYEAQRAVNPNAENEGLQAKGQSLNEEDPAMSEPLRFLDAVGEALDVPELLVVGNLRITVGSPTLDDLLTLFKTLKASTGTLEELAAKADSMAETMNENNLSALLKTAPAARTVFLNTITVEGRDFANEDEKWDWFAKKLSAIDAIDIMEMFEARTDWVKMISKVKRIMGKLQGLAVQVRQGKSQD
jgi:hypothetical protein